MVMVILNDDVFEYMSLCRWTTCGAAQKWPKTQYSKQCSMGPPRRFPLYCTERPSAGHLSTMIKKALSKDHREGG